MKMWLTALAGLLAAAGLSGSTAAQSAELLVMTGMGPSTGVYELAAGFEKATKNKVTVTFETGPTLEQKLQTNAPADLIAGGPEQIEDLIKKGKVVAGTHTPFGLAGLGVSVKAGAPRPDIGTVEAYKALLLAAKSIGYSRGCSGTHTAEGIAKLGIADQVKAKTVLTGGGPVAEYLAKGDFEVGIQQTNVLVGIPGTDYVGPLPGALNRPCPFSVGLMVVSKQQDLARAMIKFMTSLDGVSLLQKGHMEPVRLGS
jgi:molybdate transport system substrate-binding protein